MVAVIYVAVEAVGRLAVFGHCNRDNFSNSRHGISRGNSP